jgi:SAM-dependent methyltransferase
MASDRNPQARQMADESMVRGLAAQAAAIWPQEREIIASYGLAGNLRILDLACGTGEATARLAEMFPGAEVVGIDVHEAHLELARERCAFAGERVRFEVGDAFALDRPAGDFDLALCRHLVQAVPEPERIAKELARVTKPGGRVHFIAEDYGMMHFAPTRTDTDRFWADGPAEFARKTGSDLRIGRKMVTILRSLGLESLRVDYVIVDTLRVAPETFAAIWAAWRDGYADAIASETRFTLEEVHEHFRDMIAAIESPDGYAVWQLPVVSGVCP